MESGCLRTLELRKQHRPDGQSSSNQKTGAERDGSRGNHEWILCLAERCGTSILECQKGQRKPVLMVPFAAGRQAASAQYPDCIEEIGAGEANRTPDPNLGKFSTPCLPPRALPPKAMSTSINRCVQRRIRSLL